MVGMLFILRVADSLFWARAIHSIVPVSPMLVTISRSIVMDLTSSIIVFVRGCFWAFHCGREGQRFTQTHGARYERWRACKAIWLAPDLQRLGSHLPGTGGEA